MGAALLTVAGSVIRMIGPGALLLAGLAGCTTPSGMLTGAGDAGPGAIPVGENLAGEPCRARLARTPPPDPAVLRSYEVFCGRWEQPSGQVFEVAASGNASVDARQLAQAGWWRSDLESRMACRPPEPARMLDGSDARLLACTFRRGGWAYFGMTGAQGSSVFLAEGIPAALPPIEAAIAIAAGRSAPAPVAQGGRLSAAAEQMQARLGTSLYGGGDIQDYQSLLALAQYFNTVKAFAAAEERYRQALAVHARLVPQDDAGRALVLMNLALELSNQQRFAEADELFDRTEALLHQPFDPTDLPRLTSYRALHLANQGRPEQALALAREATRQREALIRQMGFAVAPGPAERAVAGAGLRPDRPIQAGPAGLLHGDLVQSRYAEAAMLHRLGQLAEAEAAAANALSLAENAPGVPRWWRPQILLLQGEIAEARGQYATAERRLRDSLTAQHALFTNSRPEGLTRLALGRVYARLGRTADAFNSFRAGFLIIGGQGGGLSFDAVLPFFRLALDDARRRPDQQSPLHAEMFEVAQLVRGTVTTQTIALAAARLSAGDDMAAGVLRDLQDAQRERDRLNEMMTRLQGNPDTLATALDALNRQLAQTAARIGELEVQLQAALPRYNLLIDAPVRSAEVAGLLEPDEALVQILVGEPQSMVFLVTARGVEAHAVSLSLAQARELVRLLRSAFDRPDGVVPFNLAAAHALYRLVFGPIAGRLQGIEHIITVPSGPLLSLPFGLLVAEPPPRETGADYRGVSWLARRTALSLVPSVRSFVDLRGVARPSTASRPFVGFGDFLPVGDAGQILQARGLPPACRDQAAIVAQASPLPGTRREITEVAAVLAGGPESILLGADFSRNSLGRLPLNQYRVVYFATHGLLPSQLNCWDEPALLMSRAQDVPGDDGLLTASQILGLDLDADLVVLSACNTGGSDGATGGEALTGLTRAFFYAGARTLLASHWEIPDQPTVRLMVGTFEELGRNGATMAEALRRGQTAMIDDPALAHPIHWAGFTVVGDGRRRLRR